MKSRAAILIACLALALLAFVPAGGCASKKPTKSGNAAMTAKPPATAAPQLMFDSPQSAVDALVNAARLRNRDELRSIFGPNVDRLGSGSKEQDDIDLQMFVASCEVRRMLVPNADKTYSLVVGEQDWVFPAPIASDGRYWYFDTAAGVNELITRTISENEFALIDAMDAFVEAQDSFYEMDPDSDGVKAYAASIRSTPGMRDGLYWPDEEGTPMSPLGPLIAGAVAAGQLPGNPDGSLGGPMVGEGIQPYRGYYFRILTSQSAGADGGAMSYIDASGRMTLGYALLAWPASYNETGVMSFIIARGDVVYQKDLGENTETVAAGITAFDPSDGWQAVE